MNAQDQKMISFFQILSVLNQSRQPISIGEIATLTGMPAAKVAGGLEGLRHAGFPLAAAEGRWFLSSDRRALELKEVLGLMLSSLVDLPENHPCSPIVARAREKIRVDERTQLKPVAEAAVRTPIQPVPVATEPPAPVAMNEFQEMDSVPPVYLESTSPESAEPVAIEFSAEVASHVSQTPFQGGDQRTAEKPDGSVVLSLETPITPEFVQWVLSFGSHAKVLFPGALQEQVEHPQAA